MQAVIRAVLLDPEASSPQINRDRWATLGKVREPVLRFTAWARAMNMQSASGQWAIPATVFAPMRQLPLNPPSVFNFHRPGYVPTEPHFAERALTVPEIRRRGRHQCRGQGGQRPRRRQTGRRQRRCSAAADAELG
jgi:hypothetical protein